jgi:hypothetical protein
MREREKRERKIWAKPTRPQLMHLTAHFKAHSKADDCSNPRHCDAAEKTPAFRINNIQH